MTIEELTPTHPERIKWAAETLACLVSQTAERHEGPGNWDRRGGPLKKGAYKKDLHDFAYEDYLSYPVYLLLKFAWNDVLDWSNESPNYVHSPDEELAYLEDKDHEKA